MCEVILKPFNKLKSTYAMDLLRGGFPKCGATYTGKHGAGLVLAKFNVSDEVIRDKAKATGHKVAYVFFIPRVIQQAMKL